MTLAMPYGWGKVPFAYEDRLRWRILPFSEQEYEARIERLRALDGAATGSTACSCSAPRATRPTSAT